MTSQTGMTESDLIKGCLAENRLAQKELYERYKKAMYTLCYRITGDFETAEDVLQEAFLKVFRGMKSFRGESTIGAWIKTIVIRTAYSQMRKNRIFFEDLDKAENAEPIDWGDFLQAEYLEKAINSLPDGYRTVFVMIEVEGYAHKDVAAMLDISTGTSKSQLFYAKKKLREILSHYGHS